MVSKVENLEASYVNVLALARAAGDTATITTLESLGAAVEEPAPLRCPAPRHSVYEKKMPPGTAGCWVRHRLRDGHVRNRFRAAEDYRSCNTSARMTTNVRKVDCERSARASRCDVFRAR